MADISKLKKTGKPVDEQCIRAGAECSRPKCKDCVHYDVCYELTYHEPNGEIVGREVCNNFKDKSRFVELPCAAGDTLYVTLYSGVSELIVNRMEIISDSSFKKRFYSRVKGEIKNLNGEPINFTLEHMGNAVFLTREEAEKALKERESKCKL